MTAKKFKLLAWSNCLAFALMVFVNGLAGSTTLLGGKVTADISDANPTLITPAGYVFAIWGIIYLLLGIYVVFQALPRNRDNMVHERIDPLFLISCLLNVLWLFAWQYEYLSFSVVLMFLLLATLILIYIRLDIGRKKVELRERLAVHLPFSTYLGWITIASIANISATLVSMDWDGFGISQETWAVAIIIVALAISILVAITRRDVAFALVIVWAFVGIGIKQMDNQVILTSTILSAFIIALVLGASLLYPGTRRLGNIA